ncbi:MAG: PSD1 and planctomycete cytochrome C domain-containing protein [Akkermansiaceae bacterium]
MPITYRLLSFSFLTLVLATVGVAHASETDIRYGRDVRPILSDKCFFCHGPDPETREEGLRLDIREEALKGKAFIPGDPDGSKLISLIHTDDVDDIMPPPESHKTLKAEEKKILYDWIKAGAEYEPHWAYQQPKQIAGDRIDKLVEEKLVKQGLKFSEPADPNVLLRRLHFDIIGLPPTPSEVATFLKLYKTNPREAVQETANKLLASPHYGERMAVKWLDAVRYADTVGYHGDQNIDASPFRDYVIGAFNQDLPYQQFIIEQIAGDLIPNATLSQQVAASYNRLGQMSREGGIQDKEYVAKYQAERVRTTSAAFLGSTMACAECHDHKFDPFTAKDFYSFAAFFSDILEKGAWTGHGRYQEEIKKFEEQGVKFGKWGPYIEVPDSFGGSGGTAASQEDKKVRSVPATISAKPRTVRLLPRGNWTDESGPVLQPAPPEFLTNGKKIGTTRLDLAKWIASEENPLTARVYVNRVWSQFFGSGLSKSAGDFGLQGEYPSHPELLDWLAVEFVKNQWSTKQLIRTIVTSKTYQQTSTPGGEYIERDPENRMLARQTQLRLPAEIIRDNVLALSGLLQRDIGGASVFPYQPAGYYRHLNFPRRTYKASDKSDQYRRGIYTHWQRTFLHPMLKNFGAPNREECSTDRAQANTPLQALTLLNDPTFTESARVLAAKLLAEGGENLIQRVMMTCLSRKATDEEFVILDELYQEEFNRFKADPEAAEKFLSVGLADRPKDIAAPDLAAAASLTRAILNLHETITRY